MITAPKLVAEVSLQYAYDHGQFTGEMKEQMTELLTLVQDPAAMARFAAIVGGVALVKKGACKAGLGGFAGAAFTVGGTTGVRPHY